MLRDSPIYVQGPQSPYQYGLGRLSCLGFSILHLLLPHLGSMFKIAPIPTPTTFYAMFQTIRQNIIGYHAKTISQVRFLKSFNLERISKNSRHGPEYSPLGRGEGRLCPQNETVSKSASINLPCERLGHSQILENLVRFPMVNTSKFQERRKFTPFKIGRFQIESSDFCAKTSV